MKEKWMTPAWERIWCAEEISVHHGKSKDFVPEPEYFNLPPLGLIGWHYMGEFITAEEAKETFQKLGIEVPEELRKYLPSEESGEDSNLNRNAPVNDNSRTKTPRIFSKQRRR